MQCSSCMARLALTASNYGEATGFDPAPKKFSSCGIGLDASRDEGAHPSGSHRTGQTLTRIIQSNFVGECCFTSCRMDSQYVKIGLTYQLHSFPSRASLVWKEKIGLLKGTIRASTTMTRWLAHNPHEMRFGRGERI